MAFFLAFFEFSGVQGRHLLFCLFSFSDSNNSLLTLPLPFPRLVTNSVFSGKERSKVRQIFRPYVGPLNVVLPQSFWRNCVSSSIGKGYYQTHGLSTLEMVAGKPGRPHVRTKMEFNVVNFWSARRGWRERNLASCLLSYCRCHVLRFHPRSSSIVAVYLTTRVH